MTESLKVSWIDRAAPRRDLKVLSCLLLAILTSLAYSRALRLPFIRVDDPIYVTYNDHVRAGLTWKTFAWAFTSTGGLEGGHPGPPGAVGSPTLNWHPLTWLSHALDCQLYGLNASGHHFTNLLLHVLNVVILFLLLMRVTGAIGRSFSVAALFALHPFNVESVAWVAERKNVLSTLFFLLTLGAYGWYAVKPGIKRYLCMAALFAFGLASKPMVITLPFVLLLLDFWPLQRIVGWGKPLVLPVTQVPFFRLVLEKLPLLPLCAGSAVITLFAQGEEVMPLNFYSFGARFENAVYSYAMYLWKAFCPTRFANFYPHRGNNLDAWQLCLSAVFLIAVSGMAWKRRRTSPYLLAGWLWYLGTLVPVIGIIQLGIQGMGDRYAYLPLIGIFLIVVWGLAAWADRLEVRIPLRAAVVAMVLAVLTLLTWHQIGYWRSTFDLWSHAFCTEEGCGSVSPCRLCYDVHPRDQWRRKDEDWANPGATSEFP